MAKTLQASQCRGFSCCTAQVLGCGLQQLGSMGLVVAVPGLTGFGAQA